MAKRGRLAATLIAVLALLLGVLNAEVAAAEEVTYRATVTVPAPPSSNFPGASGGGDGWAVALSSTRFFNVFHHQSSTTVNCRNQVDASLCWTPGQKTIVDENGIHFRNSIAPGLYLDQATGKLYVPVVRENTAGILCIDTTKPDDATGAQLYCGFTALTPAGESPFQWSAANLTNPIQIGSRWYIGHPVQGNPTAPSQNTMLCFDLESFAPCAGQPYALDLEGATFTGGSYTPPMGWSGTSIFLQVLGSTRQIACFDTTTNGACPGSWPVTVGSGEVPPPFPLLNGQGVPIGVCDQTTGLPCFDFSGASVATPPGMATAIPPGGGLYGGHALVIGPRVYQAVPLSDQVHCYDYAQQAGCTNFPKVLDNLSLLYTVNADPYRPSCIWVNADGGTAQIQNFDAFSAGPCGQGATRVLASSVVAPEDECVPSRWTSLTVLDPARNEYTSGTIDFQDASGNPIPGFPQLAIDGAGAVDLRPLNWSTSNALPQFLITLEGAGDVGSVSVELVWTGEFADFCRKNGVTSTSPPVIPPPGVPVPGPVFVPGYRIAASDGGVFSFGQQRFAGAVNSLPRGAQVVGIATTATGGGYWLVTNTGGVYTFGDAGFFNSVPGLGIRVTNVVALVPTITGRGYWVIQRTGGVMSFGDAAFFGSAPSRRMVIDNVVGAVATATGRGYWLAQRNGGVLSFGDAGFHGSAPRLGLNIDNVVGIARTASGNGYWLAQRNGGVMSFGDAGFHNSLPGLGIRVNDVVGIARTGSGNGYYLVKTDGGVITFGDAVFYGALANTRLNAPPVAIATS